MLTDRDNGAMALVERLRALAKPATLTVGVHASAGDAVDRAAFAEFGTSTEVPRPFIRPWADALEAAHRADLRQVALDAVTGARPQEEGLAALGARFVGEIQAQMSNEPADSPATAARKGSSTPLEDTGALKAAITAEVSR